MKMSELLAALGDLDIPLDQTFGTNILKPVSVDNTDQTNDGTMIPPLQQKLELLKKSVGVDSHFDDELNDELSILKKNAGIMGMSSVPSIMISSEDNDLGA